eukprot:3831584-Pyramimonas_sp.AAC.1
MCIRDRGSPGLRRALGLRGPAHRRGAPRAGHRWAGCWTWCWAARPAPPGAACGIGQAARRRCGDAITCWGCRR